MEAVQRIHKRMMLDELEHAQLVDEWDATTVCEGEDVMDLAADMERMMVDSCQNGGQEAAGDIPVQAAKRQHVAGISPSIETELDAFAAFRMAPLQKSRKGAAVTAATCESDKGRVLTFMSWVTTVYKLQHVITLNLFASANVANLMANHTCR